MKKSFVAVAILAIALFAAEPVAAENPFPVGPPNQPPNYGDCVSTTAAGEGVEDYTVDVKTFTEQVGPHESRRPGLETTLACKGFSPPPGPAVP